MNRLLLLVAGGALGAAISWAVTRYLDRRYRSTDDPIGAPTVTDTTPTEPTPEPTPEPEPGPAEPAPEPEPEESPDQPT